MAKTLTNAGLPGRELRCRRCGATHGLLGHPFTSSSLKIHEGMCAKKDSDYGLSLREQQIVELIQAGLTDQKIAERLSISPTTVAFHIRNLLGKFQLRSRRRVREPMAGSRLRRPGKPRDLGGKSKTIPGAGGDPGALRPNICPHCGRHFTGGNGAYD